jgi:outer membrane protein
MSFVLVVACLLTAIPASMAMSEEVKIGYIDTAKIFANFSETIEAEEAYKKEVTNWKKKAEEMETAIAQTREQLQSQSLMLSEEKITEKKLALDQSVKEYREYMQEIFGEEGKAAKRNKELTDPIVKKINAVITKIAEEEGYTIVLDAAQGTVLYGKESINLTDKTIERLKKEYDTVQKP